jgi:serine/threonine protein kinase/lipopolysaccharide biosynthesis regulator YciM
MEIYKPGTMIGQYEVASLPMKGGMGVVYFCLDHGNNKQPVALKTFKLEFLPDREARDRFLREGTAWVKLGSHPHIVRCNKVEYHDPMAFLSLELIAKEQGMEDASLRPWMGSPMKVEQALLFALQIARGLQHASKKIPGFVHRDLKPENVLVGTDKLPGTNVNRLRVTDFGLATVLKDKGEGVIEEGDEATGRTHLTRGILGTPLYMAPEQWNQEEVGVYTDVYALGCILYEMLTARRVVDGRSINDLRSAHFEERLLAISESIPSEMMDLLGRCLSVLPAKRYQAWGEFTQELEQVYVKLVGRESPAEMLPEQSNREERMQEGWSYNAMGMAYQDMGKVEVSAGYFERALSIAREIGDRRGEGYALRGVGLAYHDLGEVRRAIGYLEQSLAIAREIGDRREEGNALGNLGIAYKNLGEVQRAIGYHEQVLAIEREIGERRGESAALGNLGSAYNQLGEVQRAIGYFEQQLEIAREIGERRGEGIALGNLGIAYKNLGEVRRAIGYHEQDLVIAHEIGNQREEGNALGNLGNSYYQLGEVERAIGYFEQQLEIVREIGDRRGEGNALGNLGTAYWNLGEVRRAIGYYEQSLTIKREIGDINSVAVISFNMALFYSEQGENPRALLLAQEAERIWSQTGNSAVQRAKQLIAQLNTKQNLGLVGRLFGKK